jgi:two-component system sensor histidine kinase/response regulator
VMDDKPENQSPRWLIYAVALLSGLALGLTLVFIAWNSALDENKREFSFESSKIRELITHNIQVSNDVINTVASLITENKGFDDQIFQSSAIGILEQQNYMEGLFYSHIQKTGDSTTSEVELNVVNSRFRDSQMSEVAQDIIKNEDFENVLKFLLLDESSQAVVSVVTLESNKYYILIKPLINKDYIAVNDESSTSLFQGVLCILINPETLVGYSSISNTLLVELHSESSNLSGRKLIFSSASSLEKRSGLLASSFSEDTSIQFPLYSVKLSLSKDVYWPDVNRKSIYIALFIGLGITLLLMALVRAKDIREKELSERNIEIELQVLKQTKELALARDRAVDGSRMKSDFLASMSHEIRTPLTAIIGMAELLAETKLSSDQDKYVKVFRRAGDTLLSLVNDILDLSKIEAEQLVLEHIPFNLLDVIEESAEIYAIKAAENHVELISDFEPKSNMLRTGDPARLRQIILNLISNAIKFTKEGHILLMVQASDAEEVQISVTDTGIGIPENKQQAIFASFTQADSSTTRKFGGTGLGLTISKRLVEMMNGSIRVESEEGVGSTFSFTVKLPVHDSATRDNLPMPGFLKEKNMLVLDRNQHNRTKICNMLSAFGAECVESEEFKMWDESRYQYVFLDHKILFSCDDGETEQIKQSSQSDSGPVIIAMLDPVTLHQQTQKINELGLGGYFSKPIKQSEVLHVFSSKGQQKEESDLAKEKIDSGTDETSVIEKHILLVEDNEDNRLLVRTYLKNSPYIIDEAENGKIAVEMFRNNSYSLILMDVQMPVMDGHEATRVIRVMEVENGRSTTPIIALTAHAIKEEIDKCLAAGCDTHVGKPIKKSTLIGIIEDYVT